MNLNVDQAVALLQEQFDQSCQEISDGEAKLAKDKETKKRLAIAIKALKGGKGDIAKNGSSKKCCDKPAAIEIIETFLTDNGPLPADDLKELASSKVKERGWSLNGFPMLLKRVLKDARFNVSDTGIVSLDKKLD